MSSLTKHCSSWPPMKSRSSNRLEDFDAPGGGGLKRFSMIVYRLYVRRTSSAVSYRSLVNKGEIPASLSVSAKATASTAHTGCRFSVGGQDQFSDHSGSYPRCSDLPSGSPHSRYTDTPPRCSLDLGEYRSGLLGES